MRSRASSSVCPWPPAQVPRDVFARQHCLGDVVEHARLGLYQSCRSEPARALDSRGRVGLPDASLTSRSRRQTASVNSVVEAVPPRSRVRTRAVGRARAPSAAAIRSARSPLADVAQHHQRRQQQRRRVREVLVGDVRRAAVHRLEHRRSRCRCSRPAPRRGRRPGRRTGPTRCRRTGSAAPARRTAPGCITSCMQAASTIRSS